MKRLLTAIVTLTMMIPASISAQTFATLWRQVAEAQSQDLPKTEQQLLGQIVEKAGQEHAYGHLMKALLQQASSECLVAPDSLAPVVARLKDREAAASDGVLKAVYDAALAYIYDNNSWLDEDSHHDIARQYYDQALASPAALAAAKVADWEPFVVRGTDTHLYPQDMLAVIGYEARRHSLLRDYYATTDDRRATLMASLALLEDSRPGGKEPVKKSRYIQQIDSLIEQYGDLTECGEVAIERYNYMEQHTDATAAELWQYVNVALDRWGAWPRMNVLRNSQRQLTTVRFEARLEQEVVLPGRAQTMKLEKLRGLTELTVRLYSVNASASQSFNPESTDGYRRLKSLLSPVATKEPLVRKYVGKRPYEVFADSIVLPPLPTGVYMVEVESQPVSNTARAMLFVSDARIVSQPLPGGLIRLCAVNATTGQPLPGAKMELRAGWGSREKNKTVTAGKNGEYELDGKDFANNLRLRAKTDSDDACPWQYADGQFYYNGTYTPRQTVNIYTDRAVYRPGQTVHMAAIVSRSENGRDHAVEAGKTMNIALRDANRQVIEEKKVTTDDYGTLAADFILPARALTGTFIIEVGAGSRSFRVEEYKRPTFEVEIPQVSRAYEDGDTVVVKGTARTYSGVPVDGATVKWRVVRRPAFWWLGFARFHNDDDTAENTVAEGETTTAADGVFAMDVPMTLPQTNGRAMFYNFVILADVTDQGGETHQGTLSMPLGTHRTAFYTSLPEKVLNEEDVRFAFHQSNAAGAELEASVEYRFDHGGWQKTPTNSLLTVPKMKSGLHTVEARCGEDKLTMEFTVFSIDDKRPAATTHDWFFASHDQFPMDGTPVTIQAGATDDNLHVLYTVIACDSLIESGVTDMSNALVNRKFRYTEEYGDGLLVTFAWVKDGVTYTHEANICRPMPDMSLDMKWKTFRNRLEPGQQEEWTLIVTTPDGKPAPAQVMATLYDRSLDQIAPHGWSLATGLWLSMPYTSWRGQQWSQIGLYGEKRMSWLNVPQLSRPHFDYDVFPQYRQHPPMRMYRRVLMANGAAMDAMPVEEAPTVFAVGSMKEAADVEEMAVEQDESQDNASAAAATVRQNMQETAFFKPQLVAGDDGVVSLKFTLPESLTSWRMLAVAHTKNMMHGSMSDEAVASKELMVQPNMPRFLRRGDKATVTARIANKSDETLSGTARLELLDAATERVVVQQQQRVTIEGGSTAAATFAIDAADKALDGHSLLIARFTVSTPRHSDGEQHYLPLVDNRETLTVTRPFTQHGTATATIDLKALVPSDAEEARLTVEYTAQPEWLMVQALPVVGHPHDDCAVCQAASLYSTAIGQNIVAQVPAAKHVFEQWRNEAQQTSLSSQLTIGEELSELMLNETPWVDDARREAQQRQLLAEFFDTNTIDDRMASAIDKLTKLQNKDGSWSWWQGMQGSTYMTQAVATMLVRLNAMNGTLPDGTDRMLDKAFTFLGKETVKLVEQMRRDEKKGLKPTFPSGMLEWLYICAVDGRKQSKAVADANAYLTALLRKEKRQQTIREKAITAIILADKSYVRSLVEYTVSSPERGRYYDTPRAAYSWRDYRLPTQVAAIEALQRLTPQDTTTISEMQRWLLHEKHTQDWDTPLNSTDAIYAFLNGRSDLLEQQPMAELTIDGKPISTEKATAAIGFVRTTIDADNHKTLEVRKSSKGTSWGAVYAQFRQPLTSVEATASGLSVKREYLTQGADHVTVGQRVRVRITIEADRDYDFVEVSDRRPACLEPVATRSGYDWRTGCYIAPKDLSTSFFFDKMTKGRHVIEAEYYVDREGEYLSGTCSVQCAYAPEFRATTGATTMTVKK